MTCIIVDEDLYHVGSEPGSVYLYGDDGELYEVDVDDVEFEDDNSGFWLLAAEGEDHEDYYEFVDVD